jgi:hypothetical protein
VREILNNRFTHDLAPAVRAVRLESSRFWDGYFRGIAVYGCRGRVDNTGAVKLGHHLEEVYRGVDIVVVVCDGDLGRLAYCLVGLDNWRRNQGSQKKKSTWLR